MCPYQSCVNHLGDFAIINEDKVPFSNHDVSVIATCPRTPLLLPLPLLSSSFGSTKPVHCSVRDDLFHKNHMQYACATIVQMQKNRQIPAKLQRDLTSQSELHSH